MSLGNYSEEVAILLLRTVTGILFFFQGYDKIFNVKTGNVSRTFSDSITKFKIPEAFMRPAVALSSWIEMIGGILLFLGLFKTISLYLLAGNMIFVAFVFSSIKAMWDMQFYFPRMLFIFILLLTDNVKDCFSLDMLFK